MKKRFMEPAMHRIELNLRENIAASSGEQETTTKAGITYLVGSRTCVVVNTGKYSNQLFLDEIYETPCYTEYDDGYTRSVGTTVPLEEARRFFRG